MMPTMIRSMGLMLLLAAAASTTRAEVRLENRSGDEPEVNVIATPAGPWSPTSAVTSVVLNPNGDLMGDTPPGWNSRGEKALAAWARPVQGSVELSIGQDDHWSGLDALATPGAFRQPMVDSLVASWTVTWQQDEPGRSTVWVTTVGDDGVVGEPQLVAAGILVGTIASGDTLHILVQQLETGTLEWFEYGVTYVPTQPIPIELRPRTGAELGTLATRSVLGSCAACADLTFHDVQRGNRRTTVLTWWSDASTLNAVEMGEDGPTSPTEKFVSKSNSVHPAKLVDEALRQVLKH